MFISPALEELTDNSSMSDQRARPSAEHDRLNATNDASRSHEIDTYQQELSRQLAGVDQPKFLQVKQAIQSAVQNYGDSADLSSVIQVHSPQRW